MSEIPHSVKVPRFYKVAAKILQSVQEKGASLKALIFDKAGKRGCPKHPNIKGIYALVVSCIKNGPTLDRLVRESRILIKEERLDPWLARVLMGELLWGKKKLPPSSAKPVKTVLNYEATFVGLLRDAVKSGTHENVQDKAQLKPRYVRVNTLLMSVGDAITAFRHEGWRRALPATDDYPGYLRKLAALEEDEFLQDIHVKQLFAFPPRTEFFGHELYRNGSLVLQDKATCLAPLILNPTPGSAVLDMCAAPGMKTTQLAAIMENKGTLYAVERHPLRYKTLCEFVPRHGATCVTTIRADATTITPEECKEVEFILVDPTCSGSGMDRPSSAKTRDTDPDRLAQLAAFQVILLERALTKFPRARRVVYSTCSVHPEENEQVVEKVLAIVNAGRPTFRLAENALESWPNRGSTEYPAVGARCLVADPDEDMTIGFFVAVFDRVGDSGPSEKKKKNKKSIGDISGQSFEGKPQTNGTSGEPDRNEKVDDDKKIKKGKKEKSQTKTEVEDTVENVPSETGVGRKKQKKEGMKENGIVAENGGDGREVSGDVKRKKRKKKKKDKEAVDTDDHQETSSEGKKETKGKRESAEGIVASSNDDELQFKKLKRKRRETMWTFLPVETPVYEEET